MANNEKSREKSFNTKYLTWHGTLLGEIILNEGRRFLSRKEIRERKLSSGEKFLLTSAFILKEISPGCEELSLIRLRNGHRFLSDQEIRELERSSANILSLKNKFVVRESYKNFLSLDLKRKDLLLKIFISYNTKSITELQAITFLEKENLTGYKIRKLLGIQIFSDNRQEEIEMRRFLMMRRY